MIACYRCNKPLNREERQRWKPFGLCDECELDNKLQTIVTQGNKEEVAHYWSLPADRQRMVRLLFIKEAT